MSNNVNLYYIIYNKMYYYINYYPLLLKKLLL